MFDRSVVYSSHPSHFHQKPPLSRVLRQLNNTNLFLSRETIFLIMSFCDYRSVGFIRERLLYKFTFLFKCSFKLERKRKKNLVKFLCFFFGLFFIKINVLHLLQQYLTADSFLEICRHSVVSSILLSNYVLILILLIY